MSHIHLEALPYGITRGGVFKLLIEQGEASKKDIGTILVTRRKATVEVPRSVAVRLCRKLGSACPDLVVWHQKDDIEWPDRFTQLLSWMELEAKAEEERLQESLDQGGTLRDLVVKDQWSSLGDKVACKLTAKNPQAYLPLHRFRVGSPVVLISQTDKSNSTRGVVSVVRSRALEVVLNDFVEDEDRYTMAASPDEVSRTRQRKALERAACAEGSRLAELREVILGNTPASFVSSAEAGIDVRALNASQQQAIQHALDAEDVAIIHGPPGTGKTVTLAHLVHAAVTSGQKVLACAPSNLAVDNLLEKLLSRGVKAVRLGHPIRVSESLQEHTLDLMVRNHPETRVADKLVKDAQKLFRQAGRFTRTKPAFGEKQALRDEAKELLADARRIQRQTLESLLDDAEVICATLTGVDGDILGNRQFEMCVIDEACQSIEPACWIPIGRADKVILAGDHCQLPPTVLSKDAMREGLGISMLERIVEQQPSVSKRLDVQYRMHQKIMDFSSQEFYDATLVADASVASHVLSEIVDSEIEDELFDKPVQFYDTAGADFVESEHESSSSRMNEQEADFVCKKIEQLIEQGVRPQDISVISPYAAQVRKIRELVPAGIEVDTVDGFQGREKEVIICSLVRSNQNQEIGFLGDTRRMNVALTRARRKLIVIGDSSTVGANPFFADLLTYFEQIDAYHTVWEEMY
ncbi:MAG: IGHMBP2 family helicase [Blastopirellula sp.]|nr:MAG: IGHMBP2 family helicase [Blastopirellula sp.]